MSLLVLFSAPEKRTGEHRDGVLFHVPQGQVSDIIVSVILMINATHHHMKYTSARFLSRLPCHKYNSSMLIVSI